MDCNNNCYNTSQKLPISFCFSQEECVSQGTRFSYLRVLTVTGADPGFFLGGGTLVSCSTSTPRNHIVFFFGRIPVVLENRRSSQGGGGGGGGAPRPPPPPRPPPTPCTLPLHLPLCKLYFLAVWNTTKNKSAGISQTKCKGTALYSNKSIIYDSVA